MKRVTAFAVLLVVLAAPAWAGWDEGVAAYDRGDYATAFREMKPLAEQGLTRRSYSACSRAGAPAGLPLAAPHPHISAMPFPSMPDPAADRAHEQARRHPPPR